MLSNNVSFISTTFRTVSTTPLGTAVNVVKKVTMEMWQAAPAKLVNAPPAGKSLPLFLNTNNSSHRHGDVFLTFFIFQTTYFVSSALLWPA